MKENQKKNKKKIFLYLYILLHFINKNSHNTWNKKLINLLNN